MIESILFFALGFLCAGFLALMIAPAIWRRAVRLTRQRVEATVPLSLEEIRADKDRMRAEFAMSQRRLEMSFKAFREKAAAQIIEINRNREELKGLTTERNSKNEALTKLETQAGELRTELRSREERLKKVTDKLANAERTLEERALELEKLGRMYDEASFASSSRQIELVARESEVEKLASDVSALRGKRKEAEKRQDELVAESKRLTQDLRVEKKRVADLDKQVERLTETIKDREEKLGQREKEMVKLRTQLKTSSTNADELSAQLLNMQGEKLKLETDHADLTQQMSTLVASAKAEDIEKAVATLTAEKDKLDERLSGVLQENRRLREEAGALERLRTEDWTDDRKASALLREQMNDLAAEVVKLTAMIEGPDSPIEKALSAVRERPDNDESGRPPSLADRVRALQKAASAV